MLLFLGELTGSDFQLNPAVALPFAYLTSALKPYFGHLMLKWDPLPFTFTHHSWPREPRLKLGYQKAESCPYGLGIFPPIPPPTPNTASVHGELEIPCQGRKGRRFFLRVRGFQIKFLQLNILHGSIDQLPDGQLWRAHCARHGVGHRGDTMPVSSQFDGRDRHSRK